MPILISGGGQGAPGPAGSSSIIAHVDRTLTVVGWTQVGDHYEQTVLVDSITATTLQDVYQSNPTKEEATQFANALIRGKSQSTGSLVLACYGEKPTIDLPIKVQVTLSDRLGSAGDIGALEADVEMLKTSKGAKNRGFSGNLTTTGWMGSAAPYTQVVSISSYNPSTMMAICGIGAASQAQMDEWAKCGILATNEGTGTITFSAFKQKPAINLPYTIWVGDKV